MTINKKIICDTLLFLAGFFCLLWVLQQWIIYTRGPAYWQVIAALPAPVRKAGKNIISEIKDLPYLHKRLFATSDIPLYRLEIKADRLAELLQQVPAAGSVLDEIPDWQYVPAKLIYQDQEYKVDVRFRGDTQRHWLYPKKSWRVRIDEKSALAGMKSFNWIVPEDRLFFGEESNYFRARRLGLLTPASRFVRVSINGGTPLVYWEAEQMSQEFAVQHKLLEGSEIYGDKYLFKPLFTDPNYWQKLAASTSTNQLDFNILNNLLTVLNMANDDEFNNKIFNIVDKENFYAWNIHQLLAGSFAQGSQHNTRLYYDATDKKIKFTVWDTGMGDPLNDAEIFEQTENPLIKRILQNPPFMLERNERLWRYIKDETNLAAELAAYDQLYSKSRTAFYQDRLKEFTDRYFNAEPTRLRQILVDQFYLLRQRFIVPSIACTVNAARGTVRVDARSLAPLHIQTSEAIIQEAHLNPQFSVQKINTTYFIASGGHDFTYYYAFHNVTSSQTVAIKRAYANPDKAISVSIRNLATNQVSSLNCSNQLYDSL